LLFEVNPGQTVLKTLSLKIPSQKKGQWVTQSVGPEFKSQNHKHTQKLLSCNLRIYECTGSKTKAVCLHVHVHVYLREENKLKENVPTIPGNCSRREMHLPSNPVGSPKAIVLPGLQPQGHAVAC
jgi:hypothetical protein